MNKTDYFYKYFEDSVDKQLHIVREDGLAFDNSMLHMEEFTLEESLCSEEALLFGSCEASSVKFRVSNVVNSSVGKWITISHDLEDVEETVQLGKFKVYSDTPTADRSWRDIVAYDVMYDIINTDVSSWYEGLSFPISLKKFRDSFFQFLNVECVEKKLINDDIMLQKNILATQLSGKDVAVAICELNGVFGHINRQGLFDFVEIRETEKQLFPRDDLYPDENVYPLYSIEVQLPRDTLYPGEDIYPTDRNIHRLGGSYISCEYEDFETKKITGVNLKQSDSEDDIGYLVGTNDNVYTIMGNFLVYGFDNSELQLVGHRILEKIEPVIYRPFKCKAVGNPLVDVGDNIKLVTEHEIIRSIVWNRTLSGIQGLFDDFETRGTETYKEDLNSVNSNFMQLRGKVNILKRDLDETRSELYDYEQATNSLISQTASEIRLEVHNTKEELESEISQTASEINLRVTNTAAGLQSQITQTASEISLKVDLGDVSHQLSIERDGINLVSDRSVNIESNNFTVTSENFKLSNNGYLTTNRMKAITYLALDSGDGDNVYLSADDGNTLGVYSDSSLFNHGTIDCRKINLWRFDYGSELQTAELTTTKLHLGDGYNFDTNVGNTIELKGKNSQGVYFETTLGKYLHSSSIQVTDPVTVSNAPNAVIGNDGYLCIGNNGSSKRWKHDISIELTEEMNPHKLYDLPVVQFKYNTDYLDNQLDKRYNKALIGFIAEDMKEIYPQAVDVDVYGMPSGWNEHYMIPPMLKLIQEQHEEIEKLKSRIKKIEDGGN